MHVGGRGRAVAKRARESLQRAIDEIGTRIRRELLGDDMLDMLDERDEIVTPDGVTLDRLRRGGRADRGRTAGRRRMPGRSARGQ